MANPYLKAVKHYEAAKKAVAEKKPIWVGAKKFNYKNVPKTWIDKDEQEHNNRNLATLNILNWYTHNTYIEIPVSQRMALYFDSRASGAIGSGVSDIGQGLAGTFGSMGIAGLVGGMFGGPVGFAFGTLAGWLGKKVLAKWTGRVASAFGAIIGAAIGFGWNQSGKNSLSDNAKRQLPGFMCLLPKNQLEMYLKTLFHMSLWGGKKHARLPYNYLATADG